MNGDEQIGMQGGMLSCHRTVVAEETLVGAARKHLNPNSESEQQQEVSAGRQVGFI